MRAKTEELLYLLLWAAETFTRPSFRNVGESFEGWAYRKGLLRQLQRLEKHQWLESQSNAYGDRLYRLTEAGRLLAMGGRDPDTFWQRRWDARWRLVLYDVPEARSSTRNKLRRYLQDRGFGYLQKSVWITPDPVNELRALLANGPVNVESLLVLEAQPCTGETDNDIVAGAWNFDFINERYSRHQEILSRRPAVPVNTCAATKAFHLWLKEEREAWVDALSSDPLLPAELLPVGYAGRTAWQRRKRIMSEAGEQMRGFKIE